MTDRELLELAAKAAGIRGFWVDSGLNVGSNANPVVWNPLEDDGDALRLAVKLGLDVVIADIGDGPHVLTGNRLGPFSIEKLPIRMFVLDEELAATRRAIVRAAAEIGRNQS
jgi:predicted signal transduction protein with EAL and GGDEF domain